MQRCSTALLRAVATLALAAAGAPSIGHGQAATSTPAPQAPERDAPGREAPTQESADAEEPADSVVERDAPTGEPDADERDAPEDLTEPPAAAEPTVEAAPPPDAPAADPSAAPLPEAPPPCLSEPVTLRRAHGRPREAIAVSLTTCDGQPNPTAVLPLSLLARPYRTPRPSAEALRRFAERRGNDAPFVAPGIRRAHPALLAHLQSLADAFAGRAITIVSGHRPSANRTSKHRVGRALDVRVEGVPRARVVEVARALDGCGVGYYPNSTFTHLDVRPRNAYWVDRSGPGQPADYGPWPPAPQEGREAHERAVADLGRATAVFAALTEALDGAEPAPTAPEPGAPNVPASAIAPEALGATDEDANADAPEAPGAPDEGAASNAPEAPGAPDEGAASNGPEAPGAPDEAGPIAATDGSSRAPG